MLFWIVALLVVVVSAAFICNIHHVNSVQVPEALVTVIKGIAGERLEASAVHTYKIFDEVRRHVLETHKLFKIHFFPVDLPPAPKKEKSPPPLTAEEEYLASLAALAGPTDDQEPESPARKALYESLSAVKGLPWSTLHHVHVHRRMFVEAVAVASHGQDDEATRATGVLGDAALAQGPEAEGEQAEGQAGAAMHEGQGGSGAAGGGLDGLGFVDAEHVSLGPVEYITSAWEDLPAHLRSQALSHSAAVRRWLMPLLCFIVIFIIICFAPDFVVELQMCVERER
jgi:hypothetical protein